MFINISAFTQRLLPILLLFFIFLCQSEIALGQETPQQQQEKKTGINIIVTQSPKIIVEIEAVTHNVCNGESKGAINISASGGYPPYKYYWAHGDTTQDVASLKAGLYKVAVYDNFSCSDTVEVEIKEPAALEANIESVKDILCYGYNHGEVDISVSGGKAPYSYSWNNGDTTQDLSNVNSGRYSVLITDANFCQEIITADVKEKTLIVRSLDDVENIKCNGDSTGRVEISVSGGVPPYSYSWNNGTTTEDLYNVKAGTYQVVVKDSENCTEVSSTRVIQPEPLAITLDEVRDLRCADDFGGAININVTGGKVPYAYHWNNGATHQDIAGIPAGKYSVNVIDKNGCKTSINTEISQPSTLVVDLTTSKNISFHGGKDGAIDIEVSGGVPPYKYKWSNGSEKQDIDSLKAGSYSVRVTDESGCAKIMNFILSQPTPLLVKLDKTTDITCNGDKTGEIDISVLGGVPPYRYKWSNGATSQDISNLPAGDYSVMVTDSNGFSQNIEAKLIEPPAFSAKTDSIKHILCHANLTGAIDLSVEGGVLPYKYRWSNGQATQDLVNIGAGHYSVKILDANFCELNVAAEVKEPELLELKLVEVSHVKCYGDTTGAINISVEGGVAPYTFKWNNGAQTEDLQGLVAGNYSVTVTDNNGCSSQISAVIKQPESLEIAENSIANIDCKGNSTGAISLNVFGGIKPYRYTWNTGESTKDIVSLQAGTYSLKVEDANGCQNTYSREITEPAQLTHTLDSVVNNLCFDDTEGAVNITVNGGKQPYTYAWSNGSFTQDIVNVKAGNYSVLITDANGCIDSLKATVTENPLLSSSVDITDIKCHGQNTGVVNLAVNGGVAPYQYKWSNGATSKNINKLIAGNYSVLITDAKGCEHTTDAQIAEPPKFLASLESDRNILCFGENTGEVMVKVSGGVAPYRFKWNNGDSTQDLRNIPAGKYLLTATDANGCKQTVSTTLTQPEKIAYSVKTVKNVYCFGEKDGAIDISVAGGVGPYLYNWNNGATSQDLENVAAGKYHVQITDVNHCVKTLEADITQPELLTVKLDTIINILCYGEQKGAVNVSVKGGVAPYTYSWSNGATTEDISELPAGEYILNVTDAKGCSQVLRAEVKQPARLLARVSEVKNIICHGNLTGAVSIQVTGGVQPYIFKWNNGKTSQNLVDIGAGSYTVEITDQNGCSQTLSAVVSQPTKLVASLTHVNDVTCFEGTTGAVNITVVGGTTPYRYAWSNGAATQDLQNITAGTYSLKITDAKGCSDSAITATIKEPPLLDVSVGHITNIRRYGLSAGALDINVTGGVQPYSYSWSNGATTQDISEVPGGDYSVNVKDANGCEKRINASILQPPPLSVKLTTIRDINCNGDKSGSIDINVSGGVAPYQFEWSNGMTTQNISGVPAGDYLVTVTDANGHQQSLNAKVAQPLPLTIQLDNFKNLSCFNDKTGSISVTVTGGTAPYTYKWSSGETVQDISSLDAGDYTLTVTDRYGCSTQLHHQLTQPEPFQLALDEVQHILCKGNSTGKVTLEVSGGTLPYSFYWNNGERTKDISDVMAGEYVVKVNDANNCSNTLNVELTEPTELLASIENTTHNLCSGKSEGAISIEVSGGSAPYSFSWNSGDTTQNISRLAKGDYAVKITDANGCLKELASTVTEPTILLASIENTVDVNCFGDNSGAISLEVSGGVTPYTFNWNNGAKDKNLEHIPAGDYQVTVKDANGCSEILSASVTQPKDLTVRLDSINQVLCYGENKGFVDIMVEGGTFPYFYTWNNGFEGEDLVNALAGNYSVKVQDANGCIKNLSATIEQPQRLTVMLDSLENVACSGDKTGMVRLNVQGGVAPYNYLWNNGVTASEIRGVAAGKYSAKVTDANQCVASFETEVKQPAELIKTIDAITDIRCYGDSTGSIQITVREGVPPYSFQWNTGATTEDIRGITAGSYKLTIVEGNGCQSVLEASVEEPPAFYASIDNVEHIPCFGSTTGAIDISVSGGVMPYKYAWSNGVTSEDLNDAGANSYSVMVTDNNGCLRTLNSEITEPPLLTLKIDSVKNVKCCGDNSGAIYITVDGGVTPYRYDWSHGATTEDIENLVLGVYTVNVTDANGCVVSTPDNMTLYEQVVSKGKFTTRDINFDVGKSVIRPESFTIINKIATFMKEHPDVSFRIDGHTDSDGSEESNQKLSEDRAKAIRLALIKFGIRENRLDTKGFGESSPLVPNTTAENKALNRRVEFIALTGTIEGTKIGHELMQTQ